MSYDKLKVRVGIFVFILLLNFIAALIYILIEKGVFEKRYTYNFSSYSAEPFIVGMPVKVSGFKIGRLDSIVLQDNGAVNLSFSVDEQNRKWLCEGSILMVKKPLLGASYIILYSAIGNPLLKEGTVLQTIVNNDIDDLVVKLDPIVSKIGNIVDSVNKITSYLAKDDSELMKIIKNIEQFTNIIVQNKSLLTSLTGDKKATDSLIESIDKLPKIMNNLNSLSNGVNEEILPTLLEFIKELNLIAKDIQTKLKTLDGVVNSVGSYDKDLINIKEQVKTGILKSNQIIEKVDNLFLDEKNSKVILP